MASQLENELSFIVHCGGVYDHSVGVDVWLAESTIIASNITNQEIGTQMFVVQEKCFGARKLLFTNVIFVT